MDIDKLKELLSDKTTKLILIGKAASGKDFVKKNCGLVHSKSYTTRKARPNEQDYIYVSKDEFVDMILEGKFLQYNVIHGNLYGTTIDEYIASQIMIMDPTAVLRLPSFILKNVKIVHIYIENHIRIQRLIDRLWDTERISDRIKEDNRLFSDDIMNHLEEYPYNMLSVKSEDQHILEYVNGFYKSDKPWKI